jgi:hypothetical protein
MAIDGNSIKQHIKRLYGANIANQSRLSVVRAMWLLRDGHFPFTSARNYQHPCR